MSKDIKLEATLLEKDSNGLIDWDSIIDQLTTNLYIDETKNGDNTIGGSRALFDDQYRRTLLQADATGTLPDYLNPRPLINKLGLEYREARHDEIPMHIKNMDFTNKILEEGGDIPEDEYLVGNLTLEQLYDLLDFGNDKVLGIDDARIALGMYAVYSTGSAAQPILFFGRVFDYGERQEITEFTPEEWAISIATVVDRIWDEDEQRHDVLLDYIDDGINRHSIQIPIVKRGDGTYFLDCHPTTYQNVDVPVGPVDRDEYSCYFNEEGKTATECAQDFVNKADSIHYDGGIIIDARLATKILVIVDQINKRNGTQKAFVTKEDFVAYVKETGIFPSNRLSKLNSYLNLLMPRYSRRVEVEDLNKNFWVLGQVCDALVEAVWRDDGIVDAINTIIKQLNKITSEVNLINLLLGLDGQTQVKLEGNKFASMCQGYSLTDLYVNIQKGSGARKIKVPIYNNLSNYSRELDYTDYESFCSSWNKVGAYPNGGQNNSTTSLNLWDVYESTQPFRIADNPSSKAEMEGKKMVHPFFYNISTDASSANTGSTRDGWYLKTLDNMLADGADFQFVKDLNLIMYNPSYYAYYRASGSNEFSLAEIIISDKSAGRATYRYDATKVLAIPNNSVAELELIMINFDPSKVNTDKAYVKGIEGSLPGGVSNYTDYQPLNLHLECCSRATYRYSPSFVLKDAVYGRKTGIGIQYLQPSLTDKSGEKYRDLVQLSNMLTPTESLTAPCTGELKEVSESATTTTVRSSLGCYSYLTIAGETGSTGAMTYVASGAARPNGLIQGRISQGLNNTGMCWSSAANQDPAVGYESQFRYLIDTVNSAYGGLKGTRRLTLSSGVKDGTIPLNAVAAQTYTWDGQSYTVTGGWYTQGLFTNFININGDASSGRVTTSYMTELINADNEVRGMAKINAFTESIGLIYGNAFALTQYPNRVNPALEPCVMTDIANYGDAFVSNVRHVRQVFIIPICYDYEAQNDNYERDIYADLNHTAFILFNWGAIAKDVATSSTEARYLAHNIDNCWVSNGEWVFDRPPIGYIIIGAAADMPTGKGNINHSSDHNWDNPNGDCDFHYPMFYGKKIANSPYTFLWPNEGAGRQTSAWKATNIPTDALTITRIDKHIH